MDITIVPYVALAGMALCGAMAIRCELKSQRFMEACRKQLVRSKGFDRNRAIAVGRFALYYAALGQELCDEHEELLSMRSEVYRAQAQLFLAGLLMGIAVTALATIAVATD